MLGRRASALKLLPPMPRKPTRALPLQRPLSPARSSRLRSCRPSARKPGQSSARRMRHSTRRGSDLDKTVVKAPMDGAILKVNVRLGEYAQAGVLSDPLMTMGSVDPLHVRVDIDETETWRIRPGHAALASARQSRDFGAAHLCPLRALCSGETVIDGRHDRAGGYESAAGDLRIRGVCRSAGRRLYRRPEPSTGNPQPDLQSNRLQPGFGHPECRSPAERVMCLSPLGRADQPSH